MADDAAVMEAQVADIGAIDTSTDTSTSDIGLTGESAASETIDSGDKPQSGETGHLRGAELYRAVKEKLKQSGLTPAEQRSLRNAIHIAGKADEMSGGDLTRFESERQAYQQLAMEGEESLTPEDLISTVREDRQQLQGILNDIASGAPKLVDELFTDHPESAKVLTTRAMDKLAELDNERFSNYVAKSAVSYLQSQGIAVEFAVLNEFLPSMPDFPGKNRFVQAIQKLYGAVNGLETIASKQIASPETKQATETGTNNGSIEEREQNVLRYEWNRTAGAENVKLRDSEIARVSGTRKVTLTEAERKEIQSGVKEEFEARLAATRNYGEAMRGYLKSGNQRAYSERAASEGKKLLPSIVARHTNAVIDKRTQAKPANSSAKAAPAAPRGAQQSTGNGGNLVQWIAGPPKTVGKQVDYMRTSNAMLVRGEAYLKG
jgi:hypothetical protein